MDTQTCQILILVTYKRYLICKKVFADVTNLRIFERELD